MNKEAAVLLVMMEPPACHEDEFNDWYDHEHFPQRMGLPGFLSGSRWVCLDGWPRWLALYDLDSIEATRSDAYRAVSGANSTPWSLRLLPRTIGRARVVARADGANRSAVLDPAPVARLLLTCYRIDAQDSGADRCGRLQEAVRVGLRDLPHLLETRVFAEQRDGATLVWAVALFGAPVFAADLAKAGASVDGVGASIFNLYGPYRRA